MTIAKVFVTLLFVVALCYGQDKIRARRSDDPNPDSPKPLKAKGFGDGRSPKVPTQHRKVSPPPTAGGQLPIGGGVDGGNPRFRRDADQPQVNGQPLGRGPQQQGNAAPPPQTAGAGQPQPPAPGASSDVKPPQLSPIGQQQQSSSPDSAQPQSPQQPNFAGGVGVGSAPNQNQIGQPGGSPPVAAPPTKGADDGAGPK